MQNYQFIAKDFLPQEMRNDAGKRIAFLWLMTKDTCQTVEASNAQSLAPFYSNELQELTIEKAFEQIIQYIDSISHPSSVSKWINSLDVLSLDWFPSKLRVMKRIHYLQPINLQVSEELLRFPTHVQPPTAFIAHLNALDPQLTGYLLENILAKLLYSSESKWREIEEVDEPIIPGQSNDELAWNETNQKYFDSLLKNEFGEFKTIYHALIYLSIKQYFRLDFSAFGICKSVAYIDFFTRICPESFKLLNEYTQALNQTTYVSYLKSKVQMIGNADTPFHSIPLHGMIEGKEYTGEADFIIGDTILDAKAVKLPIPRTWFAQINIYRQLQGVAKKLEVISFLNNRIYRFNY